MRKDAQANREKILTTAAALFREKSVATVSMKDIATAAGIGTGTLYRNYPNKSELCLALSMDFIQQFITDGQTYLATATADAETQFKHVLGQYLTFRERRMQLLASIENGPTVMSTYYRSELYQQLVQLLMQVLRPVSGDLTAAELEFRADMLIAMLKSNSYAYQRQQKGLSRDQLLINITKLMLATN